MQKHFFLAFNDMYMTFLWETHVYTFCITARARTSSKKVFFRRSKGGMGKRCLQVGYEIINASMMEIDVITTSMIGDQIVSPIFDFR
jgi:hypothetical protein